MQLDAATGTGCYPTRCVAAPTTQDGFVLQVGVSVAITSYPQVCGCEVLSEQFCNYDTGGTGVGVGTCEACDTVPAWGTATSGPAGCESGW